MFKSEKGETIEHHPTRICRCHSDNKMNSFLLCYNLAAVAICILIGVLDSCKS